MQIIVSEQTSRRRSNRFVWFVLFLRLFLLVFWKMNNPILNFFVEDELNLNAIAEMVDELARPLPLLRIEVRERKVRNENYFGLIVPTYPDIQFYEHFRMSREAANELVNILGHNLENPNEMAPLQKKVLFSVWVLSKQESFLATSDRFGLAASTGHTIFRKVITLLSNLLPQYVTWPDLNNYPNIAGVFLRRTRRFLGVIGAIDGCHIQCKQPIGNEVDYYNRKGVHSIILQGVCDERGRFIDVYIGSPGRMHDSRVVRNSPIFDKITRDNIIPPEYHLLGDAAYPLMTNLMTPFRDTGHLTAAQTTYNTTLSSARSVIERAFGMLKGKFRRLKYLDINDLELGNHMIAAACVLHNFISNHHNLEVIDADMEVAGDGLQQEYEGEPQANLEAVAKRNNIVSNFQ